MVVLDHFPLNRPPCFPQMLNLALKEGNESVSEDSTLRVSSPIWRGRGWLPRVFYQKKRAEGWWWALFLIGVPLAAAHLCPQGTPPPGRAAPALVLGPPHSRLLTCCSVRAIKCDAGVPPGSCPWLYLWTWFLGSQEERTPLQDPPPRLPGAMTQKKRVLGLCDTHLLCVNKCLQFYIKDGISVRALTVYFLLL